MMRSIQARIATLAGLCVFGTSAALVVYGVFAGRAAQQYVGDHVDALLNATTKETIQAVASTQARKIEVELEVALDTARALAQSFSILVDNANGVGTSVDLRRDQLNAILRNALAANEHFIGTYTGWEPNALDGRDFAASRLSKTEARTPPVASCPIGPGAPTDTSRSSRSPATRAGS